MDSVVKLCEVCSRLDLHRLTHPLVPCREPLPCSTPPIKEFGTYLSLGSIDEIRGRRSACDVCSLVAACLDREPADLDGQCRITESAQFCRFRLPTTICASDPAITHFHLTQASVIFDTFAADQFQGPTLPWESKEKDIRSTHYILNLQSRARSCFNAGGPVHSLQTEDDFLAEVGGRDVGTQMNAELIRAWLHQCETEHQRRCSLTWKLPADRDKDPTFVIDVIQSCIVDTPLRCRYVALSYVWGKARVFRHLLENTNDLRRTGSLCSLPIPATIRDSMILVRTIGERYLWVDSLCIIQDDLMMQQVEITRMAAIYSKALFTIIAAVGDHADSGLPGVKPGSRERVQKILRVGNRELLTVIDLRKLPWGIDETAWAQRAWTFQERIMSDRVLVFSEHQVYWSCREASHSEERALEQAREVDRLHLTFSQSSSGNAISREPLDPSRYSLIYDALLGTYRQRHLTYNTDLLNAFSGVSDILAAVQNDKFLWGLPESLFTYAITWSFTGYSERNYVEVPVLGKNGSKQVVPFPSWSWAAWSGDDPSNMPFIHAGDGYNVEPVTHFYMVDGEYQLTKINERLQVDFQKGSPRALWLRRQPDEPPILTRYPVPRMGQLHFWTSFANVRASREIKFYGHKQMNYRPLPPCDFHPGAGAEIIHQDFIVIAARRAIRKLVLLAIEWRDGVAYRVGNADIWEEDWARVENREWRFIVMG